MSLLSKFFKFREKSDGDIVKPFLEHMEDLRWTLLKIIVTLLISTIFSFLFVDDITYFLKRPLPPEIKLISTTLTGGFVASLELSFFSGIAIALPFLIYFLAAFILPALTRQEKKFLFPGIVTSALLFAAGGFVSYHWILPKTLLFFVDYNKKLGIESLFTWNSYVSFCIWLTIGFGLLCQLPVAVVVLAFVGIVDYKFLSRTRAYAIVAIMVLTAIVAPTPDPVTFITLGTPIIVLYEACIWIVWLMDRKRKKRLAAGQEFPD
jgi:sec-independent protein translocase protein TatC